MPRFVFVFTHSPTKGHLDCSQVLATRNKVAVNIHVRVFALKVFNSFGLKNVIAGLFGKTVGVFLERNCQTVLQSDCYFTFPPAINETLLLTTASLATGIVFWILVILIIVYFTVVL